MKPPPQLPCSQCGRIAQRIKRLPDGGLCRRCYNDSRKVNCANCGKLRTPTKRTDDGHLLCSHCARPKRGCTQCERVGHVAKLVDGRPICRRCYQAPTRTCGRCGEAKEVAARAQDGVADLCKRCYRAPDAPCGVCGLTLPTHSMWPIGPVCVGCYRRVLRAPGSCSQCRQYRALIGHSSDGDPICGPCAGSPQDYLCTNCGAAGEQHFTGLCKRCSLVIAAERILTSVTGTIRPELAGLPAALADHGRADSTMRWLDRPIPKALLASLADGDVISHASLNDCPPGQAREHLRALLIAAGVLPSRDQYADQLETWADEYIAGLPPHHTALIRPYARWMVIRTVRRRAQKRRTTVGVAASAGERIRAAARLLRHLDERGETINDLTQSALDEWLTGNRTRASNILPFINWLNDRDITHDLLVVRPKNQKPTRVNPEDVQHTRILRLLTAHTPKDDLVARVAGLLILLYGARLEHILRLTTANITRTPSGANLALSTHPIELPAELAALLERLAQHAEQSPRARTLAGDTHYLFPSTRRPNAPLHPTALGRRLARIGVRPRIDRNTAMATLAADLPAAVIAAQFGLTSQAATTWAQHSRRDSLEYLAARSEPSSGGTTVERSCSRSL